MGNIHSAATGVRRRIHWLCHSAEVDISGYSAGALKDEIRSTITHMWHKTNVRINGYHDRDRYQNVIFEAR